jgi:hypothetical protein
MKTLVRAAEIWVLSKDRTRLEFGGGLDAFGTVNDISCFGFAEGLAAKAWAAGRPIILRDLGGSDPERAANQAAGLTCAVALPVFAGEFLMGVVVLCCGDDDTHVGAIELWHHDPSITNDLRFAEGYYGTADTFEFNAAYAKFPRGYGLPGRTWRSRMTKMPNSAFPAWICRQHYSRRIPRGWRSQYQARTIVDLSRPHRPSPYLLVSLGRARTLETGR